MPVPDDCSLQGRRAVHLRESSDTFEELLGHLAGMVADGILAEEERTRSTTFYNGLFSDLAIPC